MILRTTGSQGMDSSGDVSWSDLHLWKSILAAMMRRAETERDDLAGRSQEMLSEGSRGKGERICEN